MEERTLKKRKMGVYILSFLPGLGHFYLGLMQRGLQFMLLLFCAIFMTHMVEMFAFFIPIIVFYSYFDALQYHSKYRENEELIDEPVFKQNLIRVNKAVIAWIFIGFGGLSLLENSADYLQLSIDFNILYKIIVSAVFVIIGIRILIGKPKEEV
ncbi:hypothetical protein [Gottfriedia solisilvae]|uniref:TM2 domain-containing protein n=1 Tax=Gottfriedia solisilvae TaxID=1516104 RepID=A0A8J3EYZ7_9BACI|nr:hypothetical protein [Gottfriedia solisilvae]GGI14767.1 hypothetical protein GCM10007380_24600 [Gottfriedia solisilvae]